MTRRLLLLLALTSLTALADPPQAQTIFDGLTLNGWEGNPQYWRVEDAAITGEIPDGQALKKNEFLYWTGEVHDFELTLEFRLTGIASANSGIQFRTQKDADGHARGYQADLDDGATWLGRLYDEEGRALLVERGTRVAIAPDGRRWVDEFGKPADLQSLFKRGEWNHYRITAKASHVEVWINGTLFSVLDDRQADAAEFSGLIAFQLHGGKGPAKVQFRDIRLAHLGRTALPARPVAAEDGKPAAAVFLAGDDGRPLNLGFESGTLADWTATGTAWTKQPQRFWEPSTPRRRTDLPTDPVGNFWIGPITGNPGIPGKGTLVSTAFTVTHPWASYMIGGGRDINRTRLEIVDAATGAVIHSASGADSGAMRREVVGFGAGLGRKIFLRLIDDTPEAPWGYIAFDDFVFHDHRPEFASAAVNAARQKESPVLWHLRPNPAPPSAVGNLDAQKLVRDMMVNEGFQAELIAAEPDVHQPIAFAIDERGRLWVAEAYSYPNKQPAGTGKDRIIIFEDGDGNGSFETRKIFAEGLNLVSGLEVGFGGVWVGAAPELLFIPDANHDDKPDGPARTLLDGWGYQDTHETLNSFTWGPDGWLYGVQGVFTKSLIGKPGTPDNQRIPLRAGVWRYHPVRHEFELFANGGSNQWGLDFNEAGHLFMTHCRSFHGGGGTTQVIRHAHFWNQANSDYAPFVSNRGPDFAPGLKNFLPSSARYDSGEGGAGKPGTTAVYGGHSHVGTMIYLGDNWPDIYRDHLFTHNLHGHQINQQHNVRQGSGYETFHAGFDLLFAPDPTYVPVDLQYGPDGAVYSIDWCDHQHCHSPRDEIWERTNGRIYRLAWTGSWKPVKVDLSAKTDDELASLHTHRNEWYVRTARRLLQERAAQRPLPRTALATLRGQLSGALDVSQQVRALLTLHAVGGLDPTAFTALLGKPSDVLRAWAVQLATERAQALALSTDQLLTLARSDPSPMVRLALASALPMLPDNTRWAVGAALAAHGEDADDRFLPKMIWFGLAPLVAVDLPRALDLAESTALPTLTDSLHWYVARTPEGREQLAARLTRLPEAVAARVVRVIAFSLQNEAALPMPASWPAVARRFPVGGEPLPEATAVAQLSALFGDQVVLDRTRTLLADAGAPLAKREAAIVLLKRAGDTAALPVYVRLLEDEAFRSQVIPLLAGTDDPAAAAGLLRHFDSLPDADRAAALATLTSRPALALVLLEAVSDGSFDQRHLNALHVRQLRNLRDPRVDGFLSRIWAHAAESSADSKATITRLRKVYNEAPLWAFDAAAGRPVFQNLCAACHTLDGEGGKLGPDLTGSWRNGLDYYLENIVDPNAVVGADFQLNIITRHDGSVVSGMIDSETGTVLVVRSPTETVSIPKSQVKERQVLPQSLMPPGLLEPLPERDLVLLLKLLLLERK